MHVREMVEVAGLVALHGPLLVKGPAAPSSTHLEQYWSASRCRFESWSRALKAHAAADDAHEESDPWVDIRATLDEIFTSEMLTRVWTAVLVAHDRHSGTDGAEAIARNVLSTHMEARHRALALLTHSRQFNTEQAVALNRLRRRSERWSDVLLGGVWHVGDAREFAVEAERAADFADELAYQRNVPGGLHAWRLTLVSLRNAFQRGLAPLAANPDANARIVAAILGSFQGELFDSTGVFKSPWMMRLSDAANDAQGLLCELLQPTPRRPEPEPTDRPRRRRF
jgi:hypothetical protein